MHDFAFIFAGFAVGLIVGLTGVGGGSLMTPVLIFIFGVKPHLAIGSDLLFAAFTKMGGTVSMARQRLVPWRVVGLLCAGSIPAALAALWLLHRMGPATEQAQHLMTSTLGVALLLTAAATAYKVLAFSPQRQAAELAARHANAANAALPRHWSLPVLLGAVIGTLVTFTCRCRASSPPTSPTPCPLRWWPAWATRHWARSIGPCCCNCWPARCPASGWARAWSPARRSA